VAEDKRRWGASQLEKIGTQCVGGNVSGVQEEEGGVGAGGRNVKLSLNWCSEMKWKRSRRAGKGAK